MEKREDVFNALKKERKGVGSVEIILENNE